MSGSWPLLLLAALLLSPLASPAARTVTLPPPGVEGSATSVESAIGRRRSVREFARAPLSLADASRLLWAAQGITAPDGRRAAPSAGALYPLELHLVAARVTGLPAGTWRYEPAAHRLVATDGTATPARLAAAAGGQAWLAEAPAVVVAAGVAERTARKYGARAERYVIFEAGAAAENLALQAVALGLGTTVVGAFDDAAVARLLGLGRGEAPLVLLPVGRPG